MRMPVPYIVLVELGVPALQNVMPAGVHLVSADAERVAARQIGCDLACSQALRRVDAEDRHSGRFGVKGEGGADRVRRANRHAVVAEVTRGRNVDDVLVARRDGDVALDGGR
jgi:hypothetical protein